MKRTKVAFLGSRPLGAYALRFLSKMTNVEIVACICRKPNSNAWWNDDPYSYDMCSYSTHDALSDVDFDLGVSINYWKLLPPEIIQKAPLGFVNQHHAHNLCLRGRNMTTRAILQASETKRNYHGTCLHYINDGLDSGPIIESIACDITELDTAWSLFQKCESIARMMLSAWLPRLMLAPAPVTFPAENQPLQISASDLDDIRYIVSLNHDPDRSFDIARAFDFNGFFQQAFTIINGEKVSLTTSKRRGTRILLRLDCDRTIYADMSK